MGFLDLLNRIIAELFDTSKRKEPQQNTVAVEHLDENGELPFGWVYRNREFVNKIQNEYSYFLEMWLDSKNKSPIEYRNALKSFVLYLEDVQKLCKSKGECFEFWYYKILTSPDYLEKRREELNELLSNFDSLIDKYAKEQNKNEIKKDLKPAVVCLLKENDGILQSDFKWLFDEVFHDDVLNMLYEMHKSGELERIKSGRSYILHYKGGDA